MVLKDDFIGKMCDGCKACKPKVVINPSHTVTWVSCEHSELCYRIIENVVIYQRKTKSKKSDKKNYLKRC